MFVQYIHTREIKHFNAYFENLEQYLNSLKGVKFKMDLTQNNVFSFCLVACLCSEGVSICLFCRDSTDKIIDLLMNLSPSKACSLIQKNKRLGNAKSWSGLRQLLMNFGDSSVRWSSTHQRSVDLSRGWMDIKGQEPKESPHLSHIQIICP